MSTLSGSRIIIAITEQESVQQLSKLQAFKGKIKSGLALLDKTATLQVLAWEMIGRAELTSIFTQSNKGEQDLDTMQH